MSIDSREDRNNNSHRNARNVPSLLLRHPHLNYDACWGVNDVASIPDAAIFMVDRT